MEAREGEVEDITRSRRNRCFCVRDRWYASTREGNDLGPFESEDEALLAVRRYINIIKRLGLSGRDNRRMMFNSK